MKQLILSLSILISATLNAQQVQPTLMPNTITITSTVNKVYQADYFSVKLTLQEYDDTNPATQETKAVKISTIEGLVYQKLEKIKITKKDLKIETIAENRPGNNYNYLTTYNATQKRKISKVYSFQLADIAAVEKMYQQMRINGVMQVQVVPKFNPNSLLQIENELTSLALKKAKSKLTHLSKETGIKTVSISSISDAASAAASAISYRETNSWNNLNYNGQSLQSINQVQKALSLTVVYSISI